MDLRADGIRTTVNPGTAKKPSERFRPARANLSTQTPYDALPVAKRQAELVEAGLEAAGSLAFEWNFDSDRVSWSRGWHSFAGSPQSQAPKTGEALWAQIDEAGQAARFEAMFGDEKSDEGDGVAYKVRYFLKNGSEKSALEIVEDGKWYVGESGRPAVARGVLRHAEIEKQPIAPPENAPRLSHTVDTDAFRCEGILSRTGLQAALGREIGQSVRHGGKAGFLLVGIDGLARLNHSYGFEATDEVITNVWQRIRDALPSHVALARYTSNKLGVILPRGSTAPLDDVARQIIETATALPEGNKATPIPISLSIGGVALPDQANSAEMTLFRAEDALVEAKEDLQSSYSQYTPCKSREDHRRHNFDLADRIVSALNDRRISVAFQPVVSASSGNIAFHECLARLTEVDGSLTTANVFMPAAEQLGLARLLDSRVQELVLEALIAREDLILSLNVSPLTVLSPDWLNCLKSTLGGRPDLAQRLIVEITETVAIDDIDGAVHFVDTLHELGASVAIDDFGAGYTSFRNLKMLNVDIVKIDGEFVRNLSASKDDQVFVKTLIALAANFDLDTVAEYVETEEDAALLKEWGVGAFQGYLYGKPTHKVAGLQSARQPIQRQS